MVTIHCRLGPGDLSAWFQPPSFLPTSSHVGARVGFMALGKLQHIQIWHFLYCTVETAAHSFGSGGLTSPRADPIFKINTSSTSRNLFHKHQLICPNPPATADRAPLPRLAHRNTNPLKLVQISSLSSLALSLAVTVQGLRAAICLGHPRSPANFWLRRLFDHTLSLGLLIFK